MKKFLGFLTIGLIVIGFINPAAWIGAIFTGCFAMMSSPEGFRADGKRKSGGLFGPLVDSFILSGKTKQCPFCKSTIMKEATKCRYCGSEQSQMPQSTGRGIQIESTQKCPNCAELIQAEAIKCKHCGSPLIQMESLDAPKIKLTSKELLPSVNHLLKYFLKVLKQAMQNRR